MKALLLRNKIMQQLPPMSWNVIGLRFFKQFFDIGIRPGTLKEEDVLPQNLIIEVKEFVKKEYKVELKF